MCPAFTILISPWLLLIRLSSLMVTPLETSSDQSRVVNPPLPPLSGHQSHLLSSSKETDWLFIDQSEYEGDRWSQEKTITKPGLRVPRSPGTEINI